MAAGRQHNMSMAPAAAPGSGKSRASSIAASVFQGEKQPSSSGGSRERDYGGRDHDVSEKERSRSDGYSSSASRGGGDASRDRGRNPARDDMSGRDLGREAARDLSREAAAAAAGGYGKERERIRDWDSAERGRLVLDRERERDKVDRERERDKVDRERERDKRDRDLVNMSSRQQRRHASGEIAEVCGDRAPSPMQFARPLSAGSGSATLSIPRNSVSPAGDGFVDKETGSLAEGRSSGARQVGKDVEREPGELPSVSRVEEVSWRADASMSLHTRNSRFLKQQMLEQDSGAKRSPPKKRKFSPIVWDYDEKQARPSKISSVLGLSSASLSASKFGVVQHSQALLVHSSASIMLSSSPPSNGNISPLSKPPSSGRTTPPDSGHGQRDHSASPRESTPSPPVVQTRVSPPIVEDSNEKDIPDTRFHEQVMTSPISDDEPEPGQLLPEADESPQRKTPEVQDEDEEEDAPPPITIAGSRWAEETHTPGRDNKSPRTGSGKVKKHRSASLESDDGRISSGQGGQLTSGQSTSPEPGEYIRDKLDAAPRAKEKGNDSDGSVGQGSAGKDRRSNSMEDEEYERELNKRELMELDEEESDSDDQEEQRPEVEPDFDGVPPPSVGPQMRAIDMLQGCRSVDEFERLNRIDEGTYGVVYRARNKKTGEIVALKRVKMEKEKEGFPMTSLREINVLLSFHHPSVVDVKEVVVGSTIDSIFMVMEYMEHDLKGLMETMKQPFSQSEVKCLMLQLFEGVQYLHDNWVLHRDLKTSNLLLNNRGELKICDFGLARQYGSPLKAYTHMVVTLWYRAPELLLGSKNYQYSTAIDMWSLGCIMAEFLAKEPLFNGKSEIDQIDKIFKTLGTPTEKIWPEFVKLPVKCNFVRQPYNRLRERFPPTAFAGRPTLSESGFDLLNRLLTYDPQKRITAEEALKHDWFREVPLPKSKEFMPTFPARSEHDRRVRRLMKSPDPLEEQRKRELRQVLGGEQRARWTRCSPYQESGAQ